MKKMINQRLLLSRKGVLAMKETITLDELRSKIQSGENFTLVETLPVEYFRHTHLPGAINLLPDKVTELATTVLPDKNTEIIVYCAKFT
jgi:rhodanese-related sulfurtransferase